MLGQAEESILPIHPIKYDRSGQNVNSPTVQIWSCISTKMTSLFGILQRIGKQYTYELGAYITQEPCKFQSGDSFFQSQTAVNGLATVNVINFPAVVER